MTLLSKTTIRALLADMPDGAWFRPVKLEDLTSGTRLFQARLHVDSFAERASLELRSIFHGWNTVQVQVMAPARDEGSVEIMDYLPKHVGRRPVPVASILSDEVTLQPGCPIAYTFMVAPIEVPCPLCDARMKFWPTTEIERHLAESHPKSSLMPRDLMPWAKKPDLGPA